MREMVCCLIVTALLAGCVGAARVPEPPPAASPTPEPDSPPGLLDPVAVSDTAPKANAAAPATGGGQSSEPPTAPVVEPAATQPEAGETFEAAHSATPAPSPAAEVSPPRAQPAASAQPAPEDSPAPQDPDAGTAAKVADQVLRGRLAIAGGGAPDLASAVVYFVPDVGTRPPTPGRYTIYTRGKRFDPEWLVVPQGSTVAFPNNDPVRHNVYSSTPGAAFDLGFYGENESREHVFDKPGLVLVNCNVHHVMQAQVFVVPSAYQTRPDSNGDWHLSGLPPGRGTLHIWHPRTQPASMVLSLPTTLSIVRTLNLRTGAVR